jgi:hypothetical protein
VVFVASLRAMQRRRWSEIEKVLAVLVEVMVQEYFVVAEGGVVFEEAFQKEQSTLRSKESGLCGRYNAIH